ncbi:MAG: hypothetical protein ACO27R_11705 [Hylemonella sp.]
MAATYQRQKIGRSLVIALMLASGGAQAEKPERTGPGRDQPGVAQQEGGWRDYYREREQREKHERNEKAAQDRAWNDYYQQRQKQGYPSPQPGVTVDIRIGSYPIEPAVRGRLGPPPAGHEFIRIASDILLIAIGTGMVIDAIEDLGRR